MKAAGQEVWGPERGCRWDHPRRARILRHTLEFINYRAERYTTGSWSCRKVAALLGQARPMTPAPGLAAAGERLTALLEGLSMRRLSGGPDIDHADHARDLVRGAIDAEPVLLREK